VRELPRGIATAASGGEFLDSYLAEWRHLIDCVRRDTPPDCRLEDGRRSMQAVLAAILSAEQKQPVALVSIS
jgi:predicted dehydrogenase